ncbi:phage tail protein I [Prodigiosinella confusarubida]|uniref:Phage tail protein I n=1 Tax=Serratia sp. (strain ATCC 39006) TaxID=104623 RepID=A0A2I5T8Z9_SERS3|nr:phage tail protein I [Serratia sp. ATCC 39006]AUH00982.1 phage tail protein I [Serratia sp. ATCC 39006]AUH05303.1 phage tail protein I [Serratia sp. ATCC 39006]
MSNNCLLPPGSSTLEQAAAQTGAELEKTPIPLRQLWNPDTCPVSLLPYLAWSLSVDRWDENWPEATKRKVIKDSFFIHRHKGTIGALKRVVEPQGYLIRIKEWWQTGGEPGTFQLDIGVQENGITEETFQELERLIADAKPVSRHLLGLNINLDSRGTTYLGASLYSGDELTIYPYFPETISVSGNDVNGAAVHLIDSMSISV